MSGRKTTWRKFFSAVLALTLFTSLVVACGTPATAPAAPTKAAATAATPVPKPEGLLKVGIATLDLDQTDPFLGLGVANAQFSLLYDILVGTNPDGTDYGPVGGLATKWEQKPDATGWTFYLRKGVQWDKGIGEVTAEDVKFSLDRLIFDTASKATDRPTLSAGIDKIVVVDPYTLRIDTKSPFLDLPHFLSRMHSENGLVVPKKAIEQMGLEQWRRNPVGSGPYRVAEHREGSYFRYEAREDYWGGVPRYKEIFLYGIPEDATRVAMLKRGEIDIAEVTIPQLKELEAAGFQTVEKKEDTEFLAFIHVQWEGALAKKEVRQALQLAVNRKELADKLFEGRATPMGGDTPTAMLGFKKLPAIPYDPEQAKKLLAQAGYANGFDLSIIARPMAEVPLMAEALAGYYKAVGINATVKPMDNATATNVWREGKAKDTIAPFPSSNRRFNVAGYTTRFGAKGAVTQIRDSDPVLEQLLQTAAKSKTLGEMAEYQGKIQQHVYDTSRDIFLLHLGKWYAARPNVKTTGWTVGGQANYSFGWWQLIAQ